MDTKAVIIFGEDLDRIYEMVENGDSNPLASAVAGDTMSPKREKIISIGLVYRKNEPPYVFFSRGQSVFFEHENRYYKLSTHAQIIRIERIMDWLRQRGWVIRYAARLDSMSVWVDKPEGVNNG